MTPKARGKGDIDSQVAMMTAVVSRRLVLKAALAAPTALALAGAGRARTGEADAILRLVCIADIHSSYPRLPQIVSAVREAVAHSKAPVRIIINGDVFERGNVVALRSGGEADFAFLAALAEAAPVILNVGNHETALIDDLAESIARIRGLGITVISNIGDPRIGQRHAPDVLRFTQDGREIAIAGLATNAVETYRREARGSMAIPDPVGDARAHLAARLKGADVAILVSHAGVRADKAILPLMPPNAVLIGGHDHLRLAHRDDAGRVYFHGGSWGNHVQVLDLFPARPSGVRVTMTEVALGPSSPADPALARLVATNEDRHLTVDDRALVANLSKAMDLTESILFATEAMRLAAGADVGFLNHTSFGTGLAAGRVDRYGFDAFIRFDGDIEVAMVDGATLSRIMRLANQHQAAALDPLTGDFVYANKLAIDPKARYRIAANGWTAHNQKSYLGTGELTFAAVPGLKLKAVVAEALRARG